MSKLLKCPVCGETKPVRNDAKVCSSNCRVKQWRKRNARENHKAQVISVPAQLPPTDWQPMDTAPRDGTAIQAEIPGNGSDNIIAWTIGLIDASENDCGGWVFVEEQEPPPCWTDGICWESNEDGAKSVEPIRWKAITR